MGHAARREGVDLAGKRQTALYVMEEEATGSSLDNPDQALAINEKLLRCTDIETSRRVHLNAAHSTLECCSQPTSARPLQRSPNRRAHRLGDGMLRGVFVCDERQTEILIIEGSALIAGSASGHLDEADSWLGEEALRRDVIFGGGIVLAVGARDFLVQ